MSHEVKAEMSANVWKVVAVPGDRVSTVDTLALLESMKMEIPVYPEADGVVAEICVADGDVVAEGDMIARIE